MKTTLTLLSAAAAALCFGAAAAQTSGPREMPRDTDGDGQISKEEALAAAQASFDKLDTNGDGVLSAEEFSAPGMATFDKTDTNGDGFLSAEERREAAKGRMDRRRGRRGDRQQ